MSDFDFLTFFLAITPRAKDRPAAIIARAQNWSFGKPGIKLKLAMRPEPTRRALGWLRICLLMSLPRALLSSEATRVTIIPAVTEMRSAGIWETRPSPIVKME